MKIFKALATATLLFLLINNGRSFGQRMAILNMTTYDQDRFHFGFVLGANQCNLTVKPISDLSSHVFDSTYIPEEDYNPPANSIITGAKTLSVSSSPGLGFVISIVSNMRLAEYLDLRFIPSLSFGERSLLYTIAINSFDKVAHHDSTEVRSFTKKIPSTYINFPLEIRYKSARYNNFRAYALTGIQYTLDLASQAKKREQKNSEKIVKINASDLYAEAGVGFEFYNEWFKFGMELKMIYGLFDVLTRDKYIYTNSIASMKSKIFQVSFTFE